MKLARIQINSSGSWANLMTCCAVLTPVVKRTCLVLADLHEGGAPLRFKATYYESGQDPRAAGLESEIWGKA